MKFDYKFDYKPNISQPGSPMLQRIFHVSLGFLALVCVLLSLSYTQSSNKQEQITTVTTPAVEEKPTVSATTIVPAAVTQVLAPAIQTESTIKTLSQTQSKVTETENKSIEKENKYLEKTIQIGQGDTLFKIFSRLGLSTGDIHNIMAADISTRRLAALQPGQTLHLQITPDQKVAALTLKIGPGNSLVVARTTDGFKADHELTPFEKQLAFGKGQILDSLYSSGARAGLDNRVLSQMVDIFRWDIDFALDLQPGDAFRVLYEAEYIDGERVKSGNILAAEIINGRDKHLAIRYTDKSGRTGYFSPEGNGMRQAFLRTPVQFSRISSHFGHRHHPILHKLRKHTGVDYSAPHGTPVQATADGVVTFVGRRGGYGNVVEIQHGSRYSTLYAHLSRFPNKLRARQEIRQGQVIGYVGRTGLATGDHLHYEFRIDGKHCNPLTVALPRNNSLTEKNKRHFMAHAKEMLRLLDMHENQINMAQTETSLLKQEKSQ